ncbi:hypothetical protein ACWEP8_36790 [Streptomyces hydrogenans]
MATAAEAPATTTAEGLTQHVPNQLEALKVLGKDFRTDQISKLPKLTCSQCRNAQFKVCQSHTRAYCEECKGSLSTSHIHLDYVGHADITLRLLEADPLWTWEPLAFDDNGLPKFDHDGGLWIRLTVAGHTRLGYGDAQNKKGPNATKEAIGDALRNAAMRFGAGTVLWSKSDAARAQAEATNLSNAPSREDRLEELYGLMRKRWGHLDSLRNLKGIVGDEEFHESRVHDEDDTLRPFGEILDDRIRELVHRKKADDFMKTVRSDWNDLAACETNLAEAREKNFVDHEVPMGKTSVRVEDLLAQRIAELAQPAPPAEQLPPQQADPPTTTPEQHVERLMGQIRQCWTNPLALLQVKGDAEKHQVLDHVVDTDQGPRPLRDLLAGRIAELQNRFTNPEGSVA